MLMDAVRGGCRGGDGVLRAAGGGAKVKSNLEHKRKCCLDFMNKKVVTLTQKVIIPASPKEVYAAFVDPQKHSQFTGSKATGKPKVGGKFTTWDGYAFGRYLELEEGKRVLMEWTTMDWAEGYGPSKLELTFKETVEGTELAMAQSDVPAEMEAELAEGWTEFYWDPLKRYFSKEATTT